MNTTASRHPLGVLVLEPNPLTRFGIESVIDLHPLLHVCGEACEARMARSLCSAKKPDLIVLALFPPNGDGIELLKEFATIHPPARAIVVIDSSEAVFVQRSFRAGARGCVTKHEEPTELLAGLEDVLSGKLFISSGVSQILANCEHQSSSRNLHTLSDRELSVFRRLGSKQGPTEIARELGLSVKTVETHQRRIKEKLRLPNGVELNLAAERWLSAFGFFPDKTALLAKLETLGHPIEELSLKAPKELVQEGNR
jgi:DNA-binding NarL/FixJ family response regulator